MNHRVSDGHYLAPWDVRDYNWEAVSPRVKRYMPLRDGAKQ
jgi:hypothetical protein